MHCHISADYGNNNKYYHWKVNLVFTFVLTPGSVRCQCRFLLPPSSGI